MMKNLKKVLPYHRKEIIIIAYFKIKNKHKLNWKKKTVLMKSNNTIIIH